MTEAEEDYARPIATRTYNSSWAMYDNHLYPGGSCRLHMLRLLLGDATFWEAVRTYVARFARGLVETSDFRKVLEEVSQCHVRALCVVLCDLSAGDGVESAVLADGLLSHSAHTHTHHPSPPTQVSGRSLVRFFEQWIESPGFPQVGSERASKTKKRTHKLMRNSCTHAAVG